MKTRVAPHNRPGLHPRFNLRAWSEVQINSFRQERRCYDIQMVSLFRDLLCFSSDRHPPARFKPLATEQHKQRSSPQKIKLHNEKDSHRRQENKETETEISLQ